MVSAAADPLSHTLLRRHTSVLQKVIQARRSFKDLSTRADKLELGYDSSSSSEAIATFFSSRQQEAVETRLREQQHLHPIRFRRVIHLLRFCAYCSWRSSLLCGSLFKDILDAKCSIARIEIILSSPSCHSQVRDLLLTLTDLHNLFSEGTVSRIRHAKLLLRDLEWDLKRYEEKNRVRTLSGLSAMKRGTKNGILHCKPAFRCLRAFLSCSNMHDGDVADDCGVDDVDANSDKTRDASGMLSSTSQSSQCNALSSLHKLHMRLHQIEATMHAVGVTFDTLIPLLSGAHNQSLSQHLIDILRDDPLMFDGVAAQITNCHARLSKQLEDVREQVLLCFCYINNARDLAYAL
ncbi:hypothetical protein GOP47_0017242 [Adiantum capillus-veneris]|uniref:Uncharacterized protein n=1 Tax=Adiantum capillus-veneris TaxID=13818 RepID=A0A9D4UJJ5_ADICA|nr:hypothetical protein GOP47_0017242 [Adiantum capillus-veneris]